MSQGSHFPLSFCMCFLSGAELSRSRVCLLGTRVTGQCPPPEWPSSPHFSEPPKLKARRSSLPPRRLSSSKHFTLSVLNTEARPKVLEENKSDPVSICKELSAKVTAPNLWPISAKSLHVSCTRVTRAIFSFGFRSRSFSPPDHSRRRAEECRTLAGLLLLSPSTDCHGHQNTL